MMVEQSKSYVILGISAKNEHLVIGDDESKPFDNRFDAEEKKQEEFQEHPELNLMVIEIKPAAEMVPTE
jgi:hypothetical protein